MRKVISHQINHTNTEIQISAGDNVYLVEGPDSDVFPPLALTFQHGNPTEAGFNGLTIEVLLAIAADRLEQFNKGEFRCRENSLAITHIEEAMNWLMARSHKRELRGVYGTQTP